MPIKFKFQTLNQKLWAVVAASFVTRAIIFFILPSTPSSFATDEGTYASLTKWIGQSKPADEFPAFGQDLYISGRSIIVPASILYRIGINELDSVRLVSTTYGLCALILLVTLILRLYKESMVDLLDEKFNQLLIFGLVLIFAFLPSHFTWSNLGLRESATEFWILASFGVFFIIYNFQKKITAVGIVTLVASIAFAFSSRPQVGWVIGVSMIVYLLFNLNQVNTYFVIGVVICGVLLGSMWNQGGTTSAVGTTGTTSAVGTTGATGTTVTTGNTGSLGEVFNPLINAGELISYQHEVNQLDAVSVIETQSCPRERYPLTATPPTKADTYFCIAWRAPYMISTFLFRPIIGVDVTSTSSLMAALENLFWIFLFLIVIILILKKRCMPFVRLLLPPLIFFVLYVSGASAYQGNMGTGFRHKSLILWVVLLTVFALAWRKPEQAQRNNSQKGAV